MEDKQRNKIKASTYKAEPNHKVLEEEMGCLEKELEKNDLLLSEWQSSYHKEKSCLDIIMNIVECQDHNGVSINQVVERTKKHKNIEELEESLRCSRKQNERIFDERDKINKNRQAMRKRISEIQ